VLRRCQTLDVEGIYEVERKSFKPDDVYSVELLRFLCSYCGDYSYVYVAYGKIIGYIITCVEGNAAHVISIATDPQYRRRGVGKSLLCTALSLLAKEEVQEVFLEVRVTNEAALSLYRATGFEVVEVLKNYYSDGEDGYRLSLRDRKKAEEFCHSK
jgi:ribosomal-protein-alanine N-acetyltransferase